jgi:hypothetical protein
MDFMVVQGMQIMMDQTMTPTSRVEIRGFSLQPTPILLHKEDGQSTIEFLTTFAFGIFILFLYIKIALNMTNGFFVHFATYQASRVFLTFDNNSDSAEGSDAAAVDRAEETFTDIVGTSDVEIEFNLPDAIGNSVFVGAVANFSERFGIGTFVGGNKEIEFVSESFLGREPSSAECAEQVCSAMSGILGSGACNENTTLFDDGC